MLNLCLASALPVGIASFISTFCPYPVGYGETGFRRAMVVLGIACSYKEMQEDHRAAVPEGKGGLGKAEPSWGRTCPGMRKPKGFRKCRSSSRTSSGSAVECVCVY